MGKIGKINHNAQIAELADLGTAHGATFDATKSIQSDEILSAIAAEEKKEAKALISATKKDKAAVNLAEFDSARDSAIADAQTLAKALKKLKDPKKSAAAERISAIFAKYAGITRLSNANESGQIASLLQDTQAADVAEALKILPEVEAAIDDIKTAEEAFQQARRASESAAASAGESASDVKKRLVSCINDKLVPYLTVAAMVKPAVYEDFANKIGVSIAKLNASISQRKK